MRLLVFGLLTSQPEFEEYLIKEQSFVIGGGRSGLDVRDVVRHNLTHNKTLQE